MVCQDEIVVEINGQNHSNDNSDNEIDTNGELLQDDDEDDDANSEEKLLKKCNNNNNDLVVAKIHSEAKSQHNGGVGVNGYDEISLKGNQMGW